MYSILLVDDEAKVRSSMINKTAWNELGFEIAKEASNGLEALEMFEDQKFDVIITDIQMPYLSGIEFIQKIREADPAVTIIILSGYDEFTYAQSAIKYDVLEYVLKPLDTEDIQNLLIRTKQYLDKQMSNYKDQMNLKNTYEKELQALRDKFLISLTTAPYTLSSDIRQLMSDYNVNIEEGFKTVILLEAKEYGANWKTNALALLRILNGPISKNNNICYFLMGKYIVIIHSAKYSEENSSLFKKQNERLVKQIRSYSSKFGVPNYYLGMGSIVTKDKDIFVSYNKALTSLNYCYSNKRENMYYSDIVTLGNTQSYFDAQNKKELALAIKQKDEALITDILKTTFVDLDSNAISPRLIDVISVINECGSQFNIGVDNIDFFKEYNILDALSNLKTSSSAYEWALKGCLSVSEQINTLKEKSHVKFVEEAKTHIDSNYTNPYYSLEELCEVISISPSYFSSTFKKEVGLSFVQYLTEKRMEHAKDLLQHSDLKTYEIAKKVGFSESNYFSYCFKKYTGVSPSSFRNEQ